jgi:hypothetical protein
VKIVAVESGLNVADRVAGYGGDLWHGATDKSWPQDGGSAKIKKHQAVDSDLRLALRQEAPKPSGAQVRPPCVVNISIVSSGAILTPETAKPARDDGAGGARHVSLSKGGGAAH